MDNHYTTTTNSDLQVSLGQHPFSARGALTELPPTVGVSASSRLRGELLRGLLVAAAVPSTTYAWDAIAVDSIALEDDADEIDRGRDFEAIVQSISVHPVEDGVAHPMEASMAAFIVRYGVPNEIFTRGLRPAQTAGLLHLLGRTRVPSWTQLNLLVSGLASNSVEIRDAAIQAAENWENPSLASVLRAHRDPRAWLADYASRVANDLSSRAGA